MSKVKASTPGQFVGYNGRSVLLTGDDYDDTDPMVKALRHLFIPLPTEGRTASERARRTT